MKISTDWLKEYVDLTGISGEELAHKLTMTGTNVEGHFNLGEQLKNIVIGRIESIEKHKNADSLFVCQVNIGTKIVQIITRATNIKQNALIPVCLDGSVTANGIKIKKSKLRGELSDGMMCSLAEIGLSKADFPYADEDGIFLIEEPNCEVGQAVSEFFDLNDTILDCEITSNRPDCLSATGIAREVSASFKIPFELRVPKNFCSNKNVGGCFNVKVESKNCLRYMAKLVENVKIGQSPSWMKKRLKACGVHSINNIIDITNYVLLEFGVPMHAFDADKLEGDRIVVRQAKKGETLATLMHTTVDLSEEDLVVCDSKKPLAVAGVIGGVDSAISSTTKRVLFEVACFDKTCVRRTAQKISARTESSARFEKGLNPECCEQSMNRACELVEMLQAGTVLEPITDLQNHNKTETIVKLNVDKINRLIGFELSESEMVAILNSLGFRVENGQIHVPPYRIDIENDADIAEEVARIYGYDKIEPVAQRSESKLEVNLVWQLENELRRIFTAFGCNETYSYSFSNLAEMEKSGLDVEAELKKAVELANPFGEETRFLKTTTIPAMLNNLSFNFKNKQKAAWLFELGRIYRFDEQSKPCEPKRLTIGLYGRDANFFTLKGMIESMFNKLRIKSYKFKELQQVPFHDYVCCEVMSSTIQLGRFGEIHPEVCKNFKLNCKVFVAVLNLESILKLMGSTVIFKPISKFPESYFDLTLVCDESLTCGELENEIKKSVGDVLKSCKLFAVYHDESLGEGLKSVSFSVSMQSQNRTLEKTEIDEIMERLIKNLEKIGATLRK